MATYVRFPKGKQPSSTDRHKLQACPYLNRVEIGIDTGTGCVALRFPNKEFKKAYDRDASFHQLVETWIASKCAVSSNPVSIRFQIPPGMPQLHMPSAKKPKKKGQSAAADHKPPPTDAELAEALMKMETAGRLGEIDQTKLQLIAKYTPHALVAGGALLLGAAGYKIASRLKDNPREDRRHTTERMAKDPMNANPQAEIDPEKAEAARKAGRPSSFEEAVGTPKDTERGR